MEIHHDREAKRFYIETEGHESELNYRSDSDGGLDYYRTFTPPELRGKGLAGKVTRAALEYALASQLKVNPSCPYVAKYIDKHPEFQGCLK